MADVAPDILDRARGRDRAAFDEIVRFYRDDLLNVTYRFVGNYEDARDVLQQVFVKVYQNIDRWEPRAPFWSWLYRIAVNESFGWKRREGRRYRRVGLIEDEPGPEVPSELPDPLERAAWSDVGERILEAIERLPDAQRATFVLRFRQHLSVKETAAVLGVAEGTVKANGYHAIRRLRTILRENETVETDEFTAL